MRHPYRSALLLLLSIVSHLSAQSAAPPDRNATNTPKPTDRMMADSPVRFPEEGALPARFVPDLPTKTHAAENDYFRFSTPCRSLAQITEIRSTMPEGTFTPPPNDWRNLPRTRKILTEGGALHILALGDSIINDIMRSGWIGNLEAAYPKAKVTADVYVRGGGGCQHYREDGRISKYIVPLKPDLVIIGGISQRDIESIAVVIDGIRAALPDCEFLLATGLFGTADPRSDEEMKHAPHSGVGSYGVMLGKLAASRSAAFLDATSPWMEYIRSSGKHPHVFYRDAVHANEYGEQIAGKIFMEFFSRGAQQSDSGG